MPSDVHRLRYLRARYAKRTYYVLMKTLQTTLVTETSDVAEFRLHTIRHFYRFGLRSTLDAFCVANRVY